MFTMQSAALYGANIGTFSSFPRHFPSQNAAFFALFPSFRPVLATFSRQNAAIGFPIFGKSCPQASQLSCQTSENRQGETLHPVNRILGFHPYGGGTFPRIFPPSSIGNRGVRTTDAAAHRAESRNFRNCRKADATQHHRKSHCATLDYACTPFGVFPAKITRPSRLIA